MIDEPTTFWTDLLLAGWTALLGWRLTGATGSVARRWWAAAFFASAAAALAGGFWHGFVNVLPAVVATGLWTLTLWAIGGASAAFLLAAAHATLHGAAVRWLRLVAGGKLLLYLVWVLGRDDFLPALVDYVPTLLLVFGCFAWRYRQVREPAAPWVCGGILTAFVAAGVQAAQLAPHPEFNHNDLYHLLQMVAFWLLYRGGRILLDRD